MSHNLIPDWLVITLHEYIKDQIFRLYSNVNERLYGKQKVRLKHLLDEEFSLLFYFPVGTVRTHDDDDDD